MRNFWIYGVVVVLLSAMLSWGNMRGGGRVYSSGSHGSTWSSNTGGGSWGGGGGHK